MKTRIRNLSLLAVLIAGLVLMLACQVTAQNFTVLHTFGATEPRDDGIYPQSRLIMSDNTLYGTASYTVFAIKLNGTGFTTLRTFSFLEGKSLSGELSLSGNTLYGTTGDGGSSRSGTVFKINTDGTGFANLYSFTSTSGSYGIFGGANSDGEAPSDGLILSGNTLYGTALRGGGSGNGTVFAINTDGTGFTNLHSFTAASFISGGWATNSDGVLPQTGLILSSNTLYGTAQGGSSGSGTVFALNTDGTGFRVLHTFTTSSTNSSGAINSDGIGPASLTLSGKTIYGTSPGGGSSGNGTVFAVNTDGTGFTVLYSFTASSTNSSGAYTNRDGAAPWGRLKISGNTLYGSAAGGGSPGHGTLFALNTDGTGFTVLYIFTAGYTAEDGWVSNGDGAFPTSGLILSGNTLYGAAGYGGSSGLGTIFSISFTPQLTAIPSAANLILTWPTNYAGFDYSGYILQSTTNLASPVWTTNSSVPVVLNGQKTVTNPITGTQQFYRLSQ